MAEKCPGLYIVEDRSNYQLNADVIAADSEEEAKQIFIRNLTKDMPIAKASEELAGMEISVEKLVDDVCAIKKGDILGGTYYIE